MTEDDMKTQPEALRLADQLDLYATGDNHQRDIEQASAELRRLHESNQELLAALEKLARLGNGERYGNSEGNVIARTAINKAEGEQA